MTAPASSSFCRLQARRRAATLRRTAPLARQDGTHPSPLVQTNRQTPQSTILISWSQGKNLWFGRIGKKTRQNVLICRPNSTMVGRLLTLMCSVLGAAAGMEHSVTCGAGDVGIDHAYGDLQKYTANVNTTAACCNLCRGQARCVAWVLETDTCK